MRFAVAVVLICTPLCLFSQNITLTSEYRDDAIGSHTAESTFYRGRIRVRSKKKYDLFIAKVQKSKKEKSQSYGLFLGSKVSWIYCYAGYYYINFATGMVMGKRCYHSPDPFTSRRVPGYSRWLTPDRSGKPLYSLYGGAMGFHYNSSSLDVTCNSFYSRRQRFADPDSINNKKISSSILTLIGHDKIRSDFTETLYIQDRGGIIELILYKVFTIQSYILETVVLDASGMKLCWDYTSETGRGTESVVPYGIFILYKDDSLQVYYDYAQIFSKYRFIDKSTAVERAEAWRGGFHITHDRFILKSWIQHSERSFYTPYGNEGSTPREIYSISGAVKVVDSIHCGMNVDSEKTLVPPANQSSNIVSHKRAIFLSVEKKKYSMKYCNKEVYREIHSAGETSYQDKVKFAIKASEYWSLRFKAVLQRSTVSKYRNSSQGLEFLIEIKDNSYFSLRGAYGYYRIAGENNIYASLSPMANAIVSGQWLDRSAHIYAGKIKVGFQNIKVEGRYAAKVIKDEPIEHQVDFAARYQI